MLKPKIYITIAAILGTMVISGNSFAHTSVLSKNTPTNYNSRDELEGTTALNHFSIPHGCDGKPVKAMSVVFPNDSTATAERSDTGESVTLSEHITGNAIMGASPAVNSLFRKIKVLKGTVPSFTSHGEEVTEDTIAFVYSGGTLKDGFTGLTPWRATFPTFKSDSCATAITVYIAIANYCTKSDTDIWIGRLTEKFNDEDAVSVGYWPYLKVVRDLENNPLPEDCGEGYEISVYPSDESIDEYLPVDGYWPAGGKKGNGGDHGDHGDHKH